MYRKIKGFYEESGKIGNSYSIIYLPLIILQMFLALGESDISKSNFFKEIKLEGSHSS